MGPQPFYMEKVCRICVKNERTLLRCFSQDYDQLLISDKISACSTLDVTKDDLICLNCIKKLRISYSFRMMCIKSDEIFNSYYTQLLGAPENRLNVEEYLNCDFKISLDKLDTNKFQVPDEDDIRSIPVKVEALEDNGEELTEDNNNVVNKSEGYIRVVPSYKILKTRVEWAGTDRNRKKRVSKEQRCSLLKRLLSTPKLEEKITKTIATSKTNLRSKRVDGLKSLLGFIKTYDFGGPAHTTIDTIVSPLDRLESFSKTFFYNNFSDYHDVILRLINEREEEVNTDEENMLDEFDQDEDFKLWGVKQEPVEEDSILPMQYVQCELQGAKEFVDFESYLKPKSSLELLQQFANKSSMQQHRRQISRNSLKCRTRGQPYINPELMEQFIKQKFKCDTCHRSFKSPAYLHSHCTKMGH